MSSRGGGGGGGGSSSNGGGLQSIPAASRKIVQSLKEIVNSSEQEIYSMLKECNMDPNEAVSRLISQGTFHEVKSKREKKKETKDTTESTPRGGSNTSSRGARSGTDRYAGRAGLTQFSSSESGGLHAKPAYTKENGTSSYTSSFASGSGMTGNRTNWNPPNLSDSLVIENKASAVSGGDSTFSAPQPSSGYRSAWSGVPGQKSMADIVKMGRPQTKGHTAMNPYQQGVNTNLVQSPPSNISHHNLHSSEDYASKVSDVHDELKAATDQHLPLNDEWPSIEPSHVAGLPSGLEPHADSNLNLGGPLNLMFERGNQYMVPQTDEGQASEDSSEECVPSHVETTSVSTRNMQEHNEEDASLFDNGLYKNIASYHNQDHTFEDQEGDVSGSSISANLQQLNIQEEDHRTQPEEAGPSVVIPDHLQVQTADCSHLSFGSFGSGMFTGFSEPFESRTSRSNLEEAHVEPEASSVGHSDVRNADYYASESIRTSDGSLVHRTGAGAGNYDSQPSASQPEVLKQENPEVAHANQYTFPSSTPVYTYDNAQLLNAALPHSQTSSQMQNLTPFSSVMSAYTNPLPSTLLAANGHIVRESDLSYSPFPMTQSMPSKYGNPVSSINISTISMAEGLKTVGFSSSQPTQQTPPGNPVATGPVLSQHLAVHPYSQQTLPLAPFTNIVGYPFMPQSYTYMPPGFQQTFAGNSTYHQSLAAVLPQYKNSVSVSSLPQSPASGYGSFGSSATIPGNYTMNPPAGPAGSTIGYDDVLSAQYKDNSLLSLQQSENSGLWVHGAGSRALSAVPASTYYSFQGQNQQPGGFRQGQQPSQNYGAQLGYPNFYHSQSGISLEHQQQQQNSRDGSLSGSQGQPKQSQQQLWQNSY